MILVAGIGATVAMLWFLGLGPFSVIPEQTYVVRIPINTRPIPAYASVQREDLMNADGFTYQKIPPETVVGLSASGVSNDGELVEGAIESVKDVDGRVVVVIGGQDVPQGRLNELGGALMSVNSIIGRVVKKDKRPGLGFRESTFFPRGTPEGIAGATPPGMRALTLDANKLRGIHSLNAGNRLDLLASVPLGESVTATPPSGLLTNERPSKSNVASEPVLLAKDALLLRPVTVRNQASTTSSLTSGKRVVNEPKYEVTIAVTPRDVVPLQNALEKGLAITCLAASMQEADEEAEEPEVVTDQLMAPVTMRAIPAYQVITRADFVNPATRTIRREPISDEQVATFGVQIRIEDMLGSVARHDIPAGSFVRQNDLLKTQRQQERQQGYGTASAETTTGDWQPTVMPVQPAQQTQDTNANIIGDRPAVTRFVPAGRVAIAVPWNRIYGSEHLQIDDHFDLLASYSLQRNRNVRSTETRADQNVVSKEYEEIIARGTDRTRDETLGERGEPWFVATDAIVVGPVGFPPPAAALRAIGGRQAGNNGSGSNRNGPSGPAILLAVDSRDVESLATVLNTPGAVFSAAFRPQGNLQTIPAGFRHVAVAPVEMFAYTEFSELQWKGLRREITGRLVAADDPRFADAITMDQIGQYYGRVLNTAKTRFATFKDADFLPAGAEAGVAAGIDADHVLVNVTSDQVQSLNRFRDNDEVALVLTGNTILPPGAVSHTALLGPTSRVVVQSVRIVRAASDISDTISLAVHRDDMAALTTALFRHDATDNADKHDYRLMAVARQRSGGADTGGDGFGNVEGNTADHAQAESAPLLGVDPLKSATRIYEITGGTARTHYFVAEEN